MAEIWTDGSGFNGVNSCYCISKGQRNPPIFILEEERDHIFMECLAVLKALEQATSSDKLYSDCKTILNLIDLGQGHADKLINLMLQEIKKLRDEKKCTLTWIPREQNKAGIAIEKRLDQLREYRRQCASGSFLKSRRKHAKIR